MRGPMFRNTPQSMNNSVLACAKNLVLCRQKETPVADRRRVSNTAVREVRHFARQRTLVTKECKVPGHGMFWILC